ncbi:MAG: LysR family transcriptional regulator [Clostridium sp.]
MCFRSPKPAIWSAAAKELGVSQPALSKYLAELEDELGTELFLRYKKQLYPTAAGKIYLEAATRIIGVKEQTYQMISELSNGYQKTLHIGVTPLRGSIAIAQIFNQFHRRYPNVKIEMKERYMAGLRRAIQTTASNWHLAPATTRTNPISSILLFHEEELVRSSFFILLAYQVLVDLDHLTAIDIRKFSGHPVPARYGKFNHTADCDDDFSAEPELQPIVVYESDTT